MRENLKLVHVGYYRAPSVKKVVPYQLHQGQELVELIVKGHAYVELASGELVEVSPGSFCWEYEGDWTLSHTDPKNPYECVTFHFQSEGVPNTKIGPVVHSLAPDDLIVFAKNVLLSFDTFRENLPLLTNIVYYRLYWEDWLAKQRKVDPHQPEAIFYLRKYIEEHWAESMTVSFLSGLVGMSESNLFNLFRRYFRMTPMEYIRHRRLHYARMMLLETQEPIKNIAYQCGFSSDEVFCRLFRQKMGISPGSYRRRYVLNNLSKKKTHFIQLSENPS